MKSEQLETQLADLRKRQQDNLDDAICKRQRGIEIREEIKTLTVQLDMLSDEQRQIQNALNRSQRDGQFYQREIIELEQQLKEVVLSEKADDIVKTLPDFWTSMTKALDEEQSKLDHLIITPQSPQDVIERLKSINNPMSFGGGIEYIIRTAKGEYELALKDYALEVIKGTQLTPSIVNQAKKVITDTLHNKSVMTYWISNGEEQKQRA